MPVSLVAGAAGFLGSNLSRALLSRGHRVIGLDNFATSSGANLSNILDNRDFSFAIASVSDRSSWPKIEKPDFIFHLASPASPPKYQTLALETINANTVGTENLINFALENNSRILFASTSEVYGDPKISPQTEEYWGNVNPIGPRSVYDESKRLGETLMSHFERTRGLKGSIVRIFNTYGPGMDPDDGRVVSSFIRQALRGEPLTVYGDGTQTRSFCYVQDLISGIVAMSESENFGPFNLGNPIEIDLMTLGNIVASVLNVEPVFEFFDLPIDDPKQRCPDINRAKELLGWEPKIGIEEGLLLTASWMKEQIDLSNLG
jgi:nucleoside-diphosphate-sugar epimerase